MELEIPENTQVLLFHPPDCRSIDMYYAKQKKNLMTSVVRPARQTDQ
jgi:hypothetical protein